MNVKVAIGCCLRVNITFFTFVYLIKFTDQFYKKKKAPCVDRTSCISLQLHSRRPFETNIFSCFAIN